MNLTLNYIDLECVLQPGQKYVQEIAERLEIKVKAVQHERATDTCFEKADLLGWNPERVIKAVLLSKEQDDFFYGFVFPELGTREEPQHIVKKEVLPELLGITKSEAKKFRNFYPPAKIEFGTSTPFLPEELFLEEGVRRKFIKKLFVHGRPSLDDQLVDISIGGFGEQAHKISLHLKYKDVYEILHYKFGEKIEKRSFLKNI